MKKQWWQSMWYWKVAIFECLTDAAINGAMVWVASVAQSEWKDISQTAKITIWIAVVTTSLKTVKTFLSTTKQVLQDNMPDTSKQEITNTTTTIATNTTTNEIKTNPPLVSATPPVPLVGSN